MITGSDVVITVFIYLTTLASSTLIILFSNKNIPSISLFMNEWNERLVQSFNGQMIGRGTYGFLEDFFSFFYVSNFGEI
jgi:hypothetical protein